MGTPLLVNWWSILRLTTLILISGGMVVLPFA